MCESPRPEFKRLCCLYDSNVPIHADKGQKQHATAEVDCIDASSNFANEITKIPFISSIIHCPQWKSKNKEYVCYGHVEEVHICHGLGSLVQSEGHHHQDVTKEADDTNQ